MKSNYLIILVVGTILLLPACVSKSGCQYPGDPGDVLTGRLPTPETPASSGFPKGIGYKGVWITSHDPVVSPNTPHDFVWQSYWKDATGGINKAKAKDRPIIFRLEGNAKIKITYISGKGVIAADGRSAYSCCDKSGEIIVEITADHFASNEEPNIGKLWGIDAMEGGAAAGDLAQFEVVSP